MLHHLLGRGTAAEQLRKIDHVFHDRRWRSRGTWAAAHGASDHRPVVADLFRERTDAE